VYLATGTERTVYIKKVPDDPINSYNYYYRLPDGNNKKFQLFAKLENSQDKDCLGGDCLSSPVSLFYVEAKLAIFQLQVQILRLMNNFSYTKRTRQ